MPQFPLDNAEDYNGWITFRFIEIRNNVGITGADGAPVNVANLISNVNSLLTGDAGVTEEQVNQQSDAVSLGLSRSGFGLDITRTETPRGSIRLYLPPALTFADNIEYDNNAELGVIGGSVTAGLSGRSGSASIRAADVKAVALSGLNSIKDLVVGAATQDAARLAALRASSTTTVAKVLGRRTPDIVSSVTRTAVNPNRRTLFRSVRPREFTFSFTMIANSAREAKEIDAIIQKFRFHMYPEPLNPSTGSNLDDFFAYNYPDAIETSMTYNGRSVAQPIQRGVVSALQTSYNPSSMGWHIDGYPSEVQMSVTILEERPLDRTDISGVRSIVDRGGSQLPPPPPTSDNKPG